VASVKAYAMVDVKFAASWAFLGAVVAVVSFAINFWVVQGTYPGYKFLVYPGITATRFFSEELNFWPKLGVMIVGQYVMYFMAILIVRKLLKLIYST
jgi:hypothetical protein